MKPILLLYEIAFFYVLGFGAPHGNGVILPDRLHTDLPNEGSFPDTPVITGSAGALELPEIRSETENPLFNDCHYCQKNNRLWYSSLDKLDKAVSRCGFDYLEVRIDQMFVRDSTVVLTMIFCSIDTAAAAADHQAQLSPRFQFLRNATQGRNTLRPLLVIVDSVVSIRRDSRSGSKQIAGGRSLTYAPPPQRINLPTVTQGDGGKRQQDEVRRYAAAVDDFHSEGLWDRPSNRFNYSFVLGAKTYAIDGDGIIRIGSSLPVLKERPSQARIYYRIGTYRDLVDCTPDTIPEKYGTDISVSVRERYFYNQCLLDYEIRSPTGIASVQFHAPEVIDTVIRYSGIEEVSGSVAIGFGHKEAVLSVRVIDGKGGVALRHLRIFEEVEQANRERERKAALRESRTVWARGNALSGAINTISRFEGNVLSGLLGMYCNGQAQEQLLRIPDLIDDTCTPVYALPAQGRAPFNNYSPCHNQQSYSYRLHLGVRTKTFNGTRIENCENPSLYTAPGGKTVDLQLDFSLGDGYYLPKWNTDAATVISAGALSSIAVCSEAADRNGVIALRNLPFIYDRPSNNVEFSVVINHRIERDTLVLTFIGTCLDRSRIVFYRTIDCQQAYRRCETICDGDRATLRSDMEWIAPETKEQILLSRETVVSQEKMLSLYVFAHSTKLNETIGAGGVWCAF